LTYTREGEVASVVVVAEDGGGGRALAEDDRGRVDATDLVGVVTGLTTANLSRVATGRGGACAIGTEIDLSGGEIARVGTSGVEDVVARKCSCCGKVGVAGYGVYHTLVLRREVAHSFVFASVASDLTDVSVAGTGECDQSE